MTEADLVVVQCADCGAYYVPNQNGMIYEHACSSSRLVDDGPNPKFLTAADIADTDPELANVATVAGFALATKDTIATARNRASGQSARLSHREPIVRTTRAPIVVSDAAVIDRFRQRFGLQS